MRTRQTFIEAERNRARVLAFLNGSPGAVLSDVMRHMDMTKERAAQILLRMERLGEIARIDGGVSKTGRPSKKNYALVTETVRADEIFAHLTGNLRGARKGRMIVRFAKPAKGRPMLAHRIFGGL